MRSEIEQAVQLLQRGDDAGLEQALALLQNTVFSLLCSGTVRVRLHRARLCVRKELTKRLKPRSKRVAVASRASSRELPGNHRPGNDRPGNDQPRPARCKAMFAELSNYLDEELDDSLCEELEKHLDGCGPCKAFLASLEATIQDCRRLPSPSPDRMKAVRLRKEVMSRYERDGKQCRVNVQVISPVCPAGCTEKWLV